MINKSFFVLHSIFYGFRQIFNEMSSKAYDFTGFYTIILTKHNNNEYETIITKIFKDCWSLYIANVNVLIPGSEYGNALLYTYFPFTINYCESIDPILYDHFKHDKFIRNSELFPNKFRNFFACPLRVSTYTYAPFMILKNQFNGNYYTDGFEGIMLQVMSQRLNFTPIVILSGFNIMRPIKNRSIAKLYRPKLRRSLEMVI